jgi:hypothetical protein
MIGGPRWSSGDSGLTLLDSINICRIPKGFTRRQRDLSSDCARSLRFGVSSRTAATRELAPCLTCGNVTCLALGNGPLGFGALPARTIDASFLRLLTECVESSFEDRLEPDLLERERLVRLLT